jgi:hypothetical protein
MRTARLVCDTQATGSIWIGSGLAACLRSYHQAVNGTIGSGRPTALTARKQVYLPPGDSLALHASDKRECLYEEQEVETAKTHDR